MAPRSLLARAVRRFFRSQSGLAAIETAAFAPFLCLLLLGGYDVARFVSIRSGVDKVAASVADVTAQYKELNDYAMRQIFMVTGSSLKSYVSGANGVTILTSLYLDANGKQRVRWQCFSTSGASAWASKVGATGDIAKVDANLVADVNDNLMVSEVFFDFKPTFSTFFKSGFPLYASAIYRPRLGTLTAKPC